MSTYEEVHAGDVVLGHDGNAWGVEKIQHVPALAVTLIRYGDRVTGYPSAGTPVEIIQSPDMSGEARAYDALVAAFGDVSLIGEVVRHE